MDWYQRTFVELADKRVENWLLMKRPTLPLILVGIYLYLIYVGLPNYMKHRKPYDLKRVIQVYNLFQVISCVYLVFGVLLHGFLSNLTFGCEPVDYSSKSLSLLSMFWWTMLLKLIEFFETIFFVLRKKTNQVSKLHVYHHASTFLLSWVVCKFIGGGMMTFSILVNSSVHIIMYIYYFLSTLGPDVKNIIAPLKPKLTMIQMIQFCMLIIHSCQAFSKECNVPILAPSLFIPNVIILFYMFGEFYLKAYRSRCSTVMKTNQQ